MRAASRFRRWRCLAGHPTAALRHAPQLLRRAMSSPAGGGGDLGATAAAAASASSSFSPSSSPPIELFENPATREWLYSFLPENVIASPAVAWASATIDALDDPRSKTPSFYDASTSSCKLCGVALNGGYLMHRSITMHTQRIGIVSRALTLLHTFYSQATQRDSGSSSGGARRTRHSGPSGTPGDRSRVTAATAAQSCYHVAYPRSPLFDEAGVPDAQVLLHRPQTLQAVDMVDVLIKRWWRTLHCAPESKGGYAFDRVLSLSADTMEARQHRLRYLLFFLVSRGVLRLRATASEESEAIAGGRSCSTWRSTAFEREEIIGDLVFKNIAPDRMHVIFPADEGGIGSSMRDVNRILDSNHGLLAIYDYLNLDEVLSLSLANNKSKSDVVEALVGDLQALLWSTEVAYNVDAYPLPQDRATAVYLHAVVRHTLYELGHVTLMWCLESTLRSVKDLIQGCLDREFFDSRRTRRGHVSAAASMTSYAEASAAAPKYALHPLLLPWERELPGVHSAKSRADFALMRRPARPVGTFPGASPQLSAHPCELPPELRRQVAMQRRISDPLTRERLKADVVHALLSERGVPPASSPHSKGGADDNCKVLLPRVPQCVVDPFPDLQAGPYSRTALASSPPSAAALNELLRANCVVIQSTLSTLE